MIALCLLALAAPGHKVFFTVNMRLQPLLECSQIRIGIAMHNILWELDRAVFHTNRSLALSCWWRTNGKNYPCSRRRQSDESCQYQDDSIGLDCLRTLFATQLVQASGKKHCRTPKPGDDSYQSVSF